MSAINTEVKKMKKFLVNIFDMSDGKRGRYIVKADSMEEAFRLATDYHKRHKQSKSGATRG